MNVTPLHGELDVLENRRARLTDMLDETGDMLSEETRRNLSQSLEDVERRIAVCRAFQRQDWIRSRAA